METAMPQQLALIGRERELDLILSDLEGARKGKGATLLLSGEPGIGKTRLIEEIKRYVGSIDVKTLSGYASADFAHPFLIFSRLLGGEMDRPIFEEQEYKSFAKVFAINRAGLLVAQASSGEEEMDADIFAGMLSAVQDFVRDSFDNAGEQKAGLGRLEYGDMKILIEHGSQIFVTAVLKGTEHKEMKSLLKSTVQRINEEHGQLLSSWSGNMGEVKPIVDMLAQLAGKKFLVRRDLEGTDLEKERLRISDMVFEHLAGLSSNRPVILILEDLHWADESSLFVMRYIARNIKDKRIMLLATSRLAETEPLKQAIKEMREEGSLSEICLKQLDEVNVANLVNKLYHPNEFSQKFFFNISDQCAGNPFFVIEMLKQMRDEGIIAQEGGKFVLTSEDYSIPGSVEEVVHRRLDMLEPDSMAMVEFASCIGQSFEKRVALSFHSLRDSETAFEKLRKTGIMITDDGHAGFSHALFQNVVYNGIEDRWKCAYHKEIGEYFEAAYPDRSDEVLYELARNFSRTNEHSKAFDYCIRAGEKAESAFAAEQAMHFYDDALRFASKIRTDTSAREAETMERLGDVYALIGEFETAIEKYNLAIDKTSSGRKKADIHRRIADNLVKMGDSEKGNEECVRGLALLHGEECVEGARLLIAQGWSYSKIGEYEKAQEYFNKGMKIASKFNMEKEIGHAHHSIATTYWFRGNFDTAVVHLKEAIKIREKIGDVRGLAGSLLNLGSVYHLKGELGKALEYKEKSYDLFHKTGEKMGIATALNNIGITFYDQGNLDKCLEYYEKSLMIRKQIGDRHGQTTGLHNIGIVYNDKGDFKKAIDYFNQGLEINRKLGSKHGMVYDHCSLAEILFEIGDDEKAAENANAALELTIEIGAKGEEGWARRNVAKGLWKKGQWDEAKEELDKALVILEGIGEKEEIPKTYYEFGNYWRDRGDHAQARAFYDRALADFEIIGQKKMIDLVKEGLKKLDK